jgi:hypothetical protein
VKKKKRETEDFCDEAPSGIAEGCSSRKCPPPLSPMKWQANAEILDGLPASSLHAWVTPSVFATMTPRETAYPSYGVQFKVTLTNAVTGRENIVSTWSSGTVDAETLIRAAISSADALLLVMGSERP